MRTAGIGSRTLLAAVAAVALPALAVAAETPRSRVLTARQAQQLSGAVTAGAVAADGAPRTGRIVARSRANPQDVNAPRLSYSVELPQISRVQGFAFYRTSVDITNNTNNNGVVARFQYSYTCLSCNPPNGFFRTEERSITLSSFDNFHSDDFVDYLNTQYPGLLEPGAVNGSYGTLLVTFDNLPSLTGWEGTVVARNYNRLDETNPDLGTVGYAYPASLFFESANQTLVATIRDTRPNPTIQGAQRTNLGVRNTDINATDQNVDVEIMFLDPATGGEVGTRQRFLGLRPGEVRQITSIFDAAAIPGTVTTVIAFADIIAGPANATIEGYVNIIDQTTQDGSFFEMKCADTDANGCGR